jgi:hypothetical protein
MNTELEISSHASAVCCWNGRGPIKKILKEVMKDISGTPFHQALQSENGD